MTSDPEEVVEDSPPDLMEENFMRGDDDLVIGGSSSYCY